MDVVLIPAYEPDEELVKLVPRLKEAGFAVLVVDDGSGEGYRPIFDAVREEATVVTHERNRGKGAALKTGMRHIREHMPDCEYFVTCDADGQHRVEDVARVRDKLHAGHGFVLSVRIPKKGTPLRSKVGNSMSRVTYTLLANRYLSDNQSGLRGFARSHIDWLVEVEKNNYDYEMNMLYYAAKKGIRITTVPIETIYINNNAASHFNPIADTVRIYRSLYRLALGTVIGFLVSQLLILAASATLGYDYLIVTLPVTGIISWWVCALLNRFVIFKKTRCYDYISSIIYTGMSWFFYTLVLYLCKFIVPDWLPMWVAFNLVYLVGVPIRYLMHKLHFIASRTRE